MRCYYIDLYTEFSCLAGDCPATCCAGWKIVVDEEAVQRFSLLENEILKNDIFSHIQKKEGEYRFQNMPDGRCSMLDEDGLCRIQRNLEEKDLCHTCRKFPRLSGIVNRQMWLSMAASCPVVAKYLWKQKIKWMQKDAKNSMESVESESFFVVQEGLVFYGSQKAEILLRKKEGEGMEGKEKLLWHVKKQWSRFSLFLEVVEGIFGLLAEFPEKKYMAEYFRYFEREEQKVVEIIEDMDAFENIWQKKIEEFISNYLEYRLFSRHLEYPREAVLDTYCQVLGELSLFYIISFSRFAEKGRLSEEEIVENINQTYRFCAHGKKLSHQVTEWFHSLFEEKIEYIFLLQG